MEKLVSIIVPVYNTEMYIERTIKSILAQTYQKWELLLLDDGSTDSSLSICRKWASIDKRIIVSSHENCGVALTRELGFKQAKGDFVTFLDSDDLIDDDYIKILVNSLEDNEADIACCNCVDYDGINRSIEKDEVITDKKIILDAFFDKKRYAYCIWAKMYRKESIRSVDFPQEMKYAEDTLFFLKCIQEVGKIVILEYAGYIYTDNPNGAMRKKCGLQQAKDNLLLWDYISFVCESRYGLYRDRINRNITVVLFNMICAGANSERIHWNDDIKNIRKSIKKYRERIVFNGRGLFIRMFYIFPQLTYLLVNWKKYWLDIQR